MNKKKTALGMYVGCLWAVSEFTCSACTLLFVDRCYGEDIIPGTNWVQELLAEGHCVTGIWVKKNCSANSVHSKATDVFLDRVYRSNTDLIQISALCL